MTERERIQKVEAQHPQTMDELVATTRPIREVVLPDAVPQSVTRTLMVIPVDRVRWAAVLTGPVVALMAVALGGLLGARSVTDLTSTYVLPHERTTLR